MNRTIMICAFIFAIGNIQAQNGASASLVPKISFYKDSLRISIAVSSQRYFNPKEIKSRTASRMDFTIRDAEGKNSISLTPILVQGRLHATVEKRDHLMEYGRSPLPVALRLARKHLPDTIRYTASIPFAPWMNDAKTTLNVQLQTNIDCCGGYPRHKQSFSVPFSIVSHKQEKPVEKAATQNSIDIHIKYRTGSYDVLYDFAQNSLEIERLDKYMRQFTNLKNRKIMLTGYCSIEGTELANELLGKNRAEGFKRFLIRRYNLSSDQISTFSGGENWTELRRLIAADDEPYRDAALHIIDNISIYNGRESRLMQLQNGIPYRDIAKRYFTKLRSVHVEVE